MIVIYAGRRNLEAETSVTHRVQAELARHGPRLVIGSAAAGTDLIVLEQALLLGATAKIVLLQDPETFEHDSVADLGDDWTKRYRSVLQSDRVTIRTVQGEGMSGYAAVNDEIIRTATTSAEPSEPISALVVHSPTSRPGRDITAELAQLASSCGWTTERIDDAL